jgi:hypothetical protein
MAHGELIESRAETAEIAEIDGDDDRDMRWIPAGRRAGVEAGAVVFMMRRQARC